GRATTTSKRPCATPWTIDRLTGVGWGSGGGMGRAALSRIMTINVRYFAWLRERVGRSEEVLTPPATIITIHDLVQWLKSRGPEYASAFERDDVIRAAVDHTHVSP